MCALVVSRNVDRGMYGAPPPHGYPPHPGGYGGAPPPGPSGPYGAPPPGQYGAPPGGFPTMGGPPPPGPGQYGAPVNPYAAPPPGPYGSMPPGPGAPKPGENKLRHHVIDKDRCPFYTKMGACRHGDRCTKVHAKPTDATTVVLPQMYPNPRAAPFEVERNGEMVPGDFDRKFLKKHQEDFYEDIFMTLMEFGRIVDLRVCDNLCEQLLGNVYVKFDSVQAAMNCVDGLREKMFNGILLLPELSPVNDFADACCKEASDGMCMRANTCNFWHPTPYPKPGSSLLRDLARVQDKHWAKIEKEKERKRRERRDRSRSRTPPSRDSRERHHEGHRGHRREQTPEGKLCHICGNTGHLSRECPMKE